MAAGLTLEMSVMNSCSAKDAVMVRWHCASGTWSSHLVGYFMAERMLIHLSSDLNSASLKNSRLPSAAQMMAKLSSTFISSPGLSTVVAVRSVPSSNCTDSQFHA